MQYIKGVRIEKFRSIDETELSNVGDFTVLAGLNNSGKSNILRAIHLFFLDAVEPGVTLDFRRDFLRRDLNSKKRKRISVEISFSLPTSFRFRAGLETSQQLLGAEFVVRKEWAPDGLPEYFLNNNPNPCSLEDARKIDTFLRLVSVRYIPNRVIPTELISREHQALRDVLVRRLSKHKGQSDQLFTAIRNTSAELVADLSKQLHLASPDLKSVGLSTAESLADLAFRFGYQLLEGSTYTSEHEQGSGIQSLLMFRTLSLIDQDFFKQFGWKQASLWLVEEPESSLHTSLEAQIAFFLRDLATRRDGRLQAIATTHSDLQIQYSTNCYLVTKQVSQNNTSTKTTHLPQRDLLQRAAQFGISRWIDPILYHPLEPIVLVEGRFDADFILWCNKVLKLNPTYRVVTLEDLYSEASKGGIDTLIGYIKDRADVIRSRSPSAAIFLLADWDATKKLAGLEGIFKGADPFHAAAWKVQEANPDLDSTFRGIERFMSTPMIDKASESCGNCVGVKANGTRLVAPQDFAKLKKKLNELVLSDTFTSDDAVFAAPMLTHLRNLLAPA